MKKQTVEAVCVGVISQIYTRLTLAALNRVHVYYSDLAPMMYGASFSKLNDAQATAIWEVLRTTMQMDIKNGRPPLAALFVSRVGTELKPGAVFFKEYKRLTGVELDLDSWKNLVQEVWAAYTLPDILEQS